MEYAKCCQNCVLNRECLFQQNNDVESCGDYKDEENKKPLDQNQQEEKGEGE